MQTITTIGFDIARSVFQVHCVEPVPSQARTYPLVTKPSPFARRIAKGPGVRGLGHGGRIGVWQNLYLVYRRKVVGKRGDGPAG